MTTKGLLLGAVLLILAIASTLTIFKLFQNKQELERLERHLTNEFNLSFKDKLSSHLEKGHCTPDLTSRKS